MSDYKKPYNELSKYIPSQLRNTMNVSLMENLFDRLITHEESSHFYGVIGDKSTPNQEGKPFIIETGVDRYFNSLSHAPYFKIGAEENVFTFKDLMNKANTMDIDTTKFATWGAVRKYNFKPPIDLDKFINYSSYYWIQGALPNQIYNWNYNQLPEYYVIARPKPSDLIKYPVDVATTSAIALNGTLLPYETWVIEFQDASNFTVTGSISGLVYSDQLALKPDQTSYHYIAGKFLEFEIISDPTKRVFQNGDKFKISVIPLTSTPVEIKYSGIGTSYLKKVRSILPFGIIDGIQLKPLMRVLVKDQADPLLNGIYDVKNTEWTKAIDFSNTYEVYVKNGTQKGLWKNGTENGLISNVSIWSEDNYWVHKDDLLAYNLDTSLVAQAKRPIIEYDFDLELSSLVSKFQKIKFNQAPLFNLYNFDGSPVLASGHQISSTLFHYEESSIANIDNVLQRRVVTDNANFVFGQSVSYNGRNVFYKKSGILCNNWYLGEIQTPRYVINQNGVPVDFGADPSTDIYGVGDWLEPFQFSYNPEFEDRQTNTLGDLKDHFGSILASQYNLTGSVYSLNNSRNLNIDYSIGGNINLIENQFNLFLGLMNQKNLNPITLVDFMKSQYEEALNSLISYVKLEIGQLLTNHINSSNIVLDVFNDYKTNYVNNLELKGVYANSLSPIPNWPLTLPMIGLLTPILPNIIYEMELGANVIQHHDGHLSPVYVRDIQLERELTAISILRYDNTYVSGFEGNIAPSNPYKGQLWYDSINDVLKIFNIDFEGTVQPLSIIEGLYWYDRVHNVLKTFQNGLWVISNANRWNEISIDNLFNSLILLAETELYNYSIVNNPTLNLDITYPGFNNNINLAMSYSSYLIANNIDPTTSFYNSSDAFTWNYSQCDVLQHEYGLPVGIASWQKIYETYLGTSRPDLEPWKILGLPNADAIPGGWAQYVWTADNSRKYHPELWTYIKQQTQKQLCVNKNTDTLIPPYVNGSLVSSTEALISNYTNIKKPSSIFDFGQYGPIELAWRNTTDFNYSLLKIAIKIDPVNVLSKIWGFQTFEVNNLKYDRITGRILSHKDFTLHSEMRTTPSNSPNISYYSVSTMPDISFYLTVSNIINNVPLLTNLDYNISLLGGTQNTFVILGNPLKLEIDESQIPLIIGDKIKIEIKDGIVSSTFIPTSNIIYNGLNQIYVNLSKYNGNDLGRHINDYALRKWDSRLIYRFDSLIDTENLSVSFEVDGTRIKGYSPFLKINEFSKSSWIQALRIEVTQVGTSTWIGNDFYKPVDYGEDWEFNVQNYFSRYPKIKKYVTNTNGNFTTFTALKGANSDLSWKLYSDILRTEEVVLPLTIKGIQNVITFIHEYVMYLTNDGWDNDNSISQIDADTGRPLTWQLCMEKFIHNLFGGSKPNLGYAINPFLNGLIYKTDTGLVSNFNHDKFNDITIGQLVYDLIGDVIDPKALMVIRKDDETNINSIVPMFGSHLTINDYEHILIFNDYNESSTNGGLLYDQYLGMTINKLLLKGKRQSNGSKRPSFGGYYLNGNKTYKNIVAAIDDIASYYDPDKVYGSSTISDHALALVGYNSKSYFSNLNIDKNTEFNFWRGMIPSKGSNYSIDTFINSVKFESVKVDEFWAYKLAEYGDARPKEFPELKIEIEDCILKHTRLYFVDTIDDLPSEAMTQILNSDESRWFSLGDLDLDFHFSAQQLDTFYIGVSDGPYIPLTFNADKISILDNLGVETSNVSVVNKHLLKVNVPGNYSVVGYGPMRPKFNPIKLFNYIDDVHIEDIGIWHPGYGMHTPEALEIINVISSEDPTRYNYSLLPGTSYNYDPVKCWGEKEIGKIWWDTTNLDYMPYFDENIFRTFEERLARWGMLAEYSDIKVYEWVKSSTSPYDYAAEVIKQQGNANIDQSIRLTGTAAKEELYNRTRTWQGRPIAWSYVPNPSSTEYIEMLISGVDILHLSSIDIGNTIVTLENGSFSQYGLSSGMSVGGWVLNKPYGELVLKSSIANPYMVGTSNILGDDVTITYPGTSVFSHIIVSLQSSVQVGHITLSVIENNSIYYLVATNDISGITQQLILLPINETIGSAEIYVFNMLGITLTCYTLETTANPIDIGNEIVNSCDIKVRQSMNAEITIPFNSTILDNTLPVILPSLFQNEVQLQGYININKLFIRMSSSSIIGTFTLSYYTDPNGIIYLILMNSGKELTRSQMLDINGPITLGNLVLSWTLYNQTSLLNLVEELVNIFSIVEIGFNASNNQVQFSVADTSNVTLTNYNWKAWNTPTQDQLDLDNTSPFASWTPIYGDYVDLISNVAIIGKIEAYNATPLFLNTGTLIQKYYSNWSQWEVISDLIQHKISDGTPISFTFNVPIIANNFSLYINGINQLISSYSINSKYPNTVVLNNIIPIGYKVSAYLRKYVPTIDELQFDPAIRDVAYRLKQYKYDYQYVKQPVRDNNGVITGDVYYFWVQNKSLTNKKITIQQATNLLKNGPPLYLTFQDIQIIDGSMKYKAISIANLNTFVTKNNTYKLRFTKDFTLRDDPNEIDLKNVHTEWKLIRQNASLKIPKQLWDKVVDSVCGEDLIGNKLPSKVRIEYDNRHGTFTQYGFGKDQIFIDQDLLKISLLDAIINPKQTKWVNGQYVPDFINNLDISNSSSWFNSVVSTRKLLDFIWTSGTANQINGIFFAVLDDALANNYEFSDIFKTSRLSCHSITTVDKK